MIATAERAPAQVFFFQQLLIAAVTAAIAAYAMTRVVRFSTPIDDALPLVAVILSVIAAISRPSVMVAVPLLMGGEMVLGDERTRLLWFGVVVGVAFAAAVLARPAAFGRAAVLAVCAIVLLRWIPMAEVRVWREIALLVTAMLIVAAFRSTAIAVAVAVGAALFTPIVPLRTFWIPLAVLLIGVVMLAVSVWRRSSLRRFESGVPDPAASRTPAVTQLAGAVAVAFMLTFFAWSGALARALPMVWRGLPQPAPRQPIGLALAPGEGAGIDVPPNAHALIVSGANVSRLRRGTVVGRLDPGGRLLRIGGVADWGSLRRDQYYAARNGLPDDPAGLLRDYGYAAWIDGAARVPLPAASAIRVTADRGLPPKARLQVQYFELERP